MHRAIHQTSVLLAVLLVSAGNAALAGEPGRGVDTDAVAYPLDREVDKRPGLLPQRSSFGDLPSLRFAGADEAWTEGMPVNIVADLGFDVGRDRFSIPIYHQELRLDRQGLHRYDALGLQWRHWLDSNSLVSLSTHYGDYVYTDQASRNTHSSVTSLSWSGEFAGASRPRLTSTIFLGDESTKDDTYRFFGRRYYGLTFGGSFSPIENHRPYASVRFQRSDYEGLDPTLQVARQEDYSRLAAGWSWQVRPNWGLRAEANYSFNLSNVESYDYDRSQFFFSTRFDFR